MKLANIFLALKNNILILLIIIAFILRAIPAISTDFQIDEIFSLRLVSSLSSPVDIFSASMNIDNNHLLNSLFMYLAGNCAPWVYRIPSLLAGTFAVLVTYLTGVRQSGKMAGLIASCMVTISYPMIFYSAEARGYSTAMFLGVLSYYLLQNLQITFSIFNCFMFWLICTTGILSHYSFVIILFGYIVSEIVICAVEGFNYSIETLKNKVYIYLPVFAVFTCIYIFKIKNMVVLGGPVYNKLLVVGWFFSESLNLPMSLEKYWILICSSTIAIAISVYGIFGFFRDKNIKDCVQLSAIIFVSPTLMLIVAKPQFIYSRYFFLIMPFILLTYGKAISMLLNKSGWIYKTAILILCLYILFFTTRIYGLFTNNKSNYINALKLISQNSYNKSQIVVYASKTGPFKAILSQYMGQVGRMPKIYLASDIGPGIPIDYIITFRDVMHDYGLEPKKTEVLNIGESSFNKFYESRSADNLPADLIVYRKVGP
jgi:hypothetical protein